MDGQTSHMHAKARECLLHCLHLRAVCACAWVFMQVMNRLVAQTAAQPGIMTVWLDILSGRINTSRFRFVPVPGSLGGKTFQQVHNLPPDLYIE
jgi:hypothetical protein